MMMVRIWIGFLALSELLLSSLVHMLYGFYIFSTAVASDLLQALGECFRPNAEVVVKEVLSKESNLDGLPPIVLVHGIFGFGKGVCMYHIFDILHLRVQMHICNFFCINELVVAFSFPSLFG